MPDETLEIPDEEMRRTNVLILASTLATYVTAEDVDLPRKDFLRVVRDRISEDLDTL